MLPIYEIFQRVTPTPFPTATGPPPFELPELINTDITDFGVQWWNSIESQTGFMTLFQIVIVLVIVIGGFVIILKALGTIE